MTAGLIQELVDSSGALRTLLPPVLEIKGLRL